MKTSRTIAANCAKARAAVAKALMSTILTVIMSSCGCSSGSQSFTDEQKKSVRAEEAQLASVSTERTQVVDLNGFVGGQVDFNFTDIVDSITIITLDISSKQSLVGQVRNVLIADEYIYILDQAKEKGIVIFSRDGKFVRRIPVGRGPGELVAAYDFDFDPASRKLYVHNGAYISVFSADGVYERDILKPLGFQRFMKAQNGFLCYQQVSSVNSHLLQHEKQALLWMDDDFRLLESAVAIKDLSYRGFAKNMSRVGQDIVVSIPFSDTIYSLSERGFEARYVLDFSSNAVDISSVNESDVFGSLRRNGDKFWFAGDYTETSTHQCFLLDSRETHSVVYRDKESGKLIGGNAISFDITSTPAVQFPYFSSGDWFVAVSGDYNGYKFEGDILSDEDKRKIAALEEDANPIVILFKLKRF